MANTPLLGLTLPTTGTLSGTWGTVVNTEITSLIDSAIAGTTTLSTDADVTLTSTVSVANQAREAIILLSGARTAIRTVTAPAQSKTYIVINATTGGFAVNFVGVGPTAGLVIASGEKALIAWNGSDFVRVSTIGGPVSGTTGTFTGAVSGTTGTFTGAVSGTTGTFTGAVSGTTGTFTGALSGTSGTFTDASTITANSSSAALRVTQTGAGNSLLVEDSANPDSTPFVVDSSGNVGVGTLTPLVNFHGQANTSFGVINYTAGGATSYLFRRSSGSTTAPTVVASGDSISAIAFQGYDGAAYVSAAQITGVVDGTPGTNDMPGRLVFSTTADGASSPTERMRLDSAGNLGLGVTPSAWNVFKAIDISNVGSLAVYPAFDLGLYRNCFYNGTNYIYKVSGQNASYYAQLSNGQHHWYNAPSGNANDPITFTQAMTLDASGNLGVGAAPTYQLDLVRTGSPVLRVSNGTIEAYIQTESGAATAKFGSLSNHPLAFATNGTERARIDASGNLGLGVTPSAWSTSGNLQLKSGSNISAGTGIGITSNGYFQSGWKYIDTTYATQYTQSGGTHSWYTAPSGTAGTPIAFTQAMTLDASGNLSVGTTLVNAKATIKTEDAGTSNVTSAISLWRGSTGTVAAGFGVALQFTLEDAGGSDINVNQIQSIWENPSAGVRTAALVFLKAAGNAISEAARVDSAGNLGIGTSSPGYKLDVLGNARIQQSNYADPVLRISQGAITSGNKGQLLFTDSSGTTAYISGYGSAFGSGLSYALAFGTNGADRLTIDSSGNLGLGVTPSAWGGVYKAVQNGQSAFMSRSGGSDCYILSNAYYDGTNYRYVVTGARAAQYIQNEGTHAWGINNVVGTAGNAITFTQAMTLDANGNLAVTGDTQSASQNGGQLAGLRNKIINGNMGIAQRGASTSLTTSGQYSLDRWVFSFNGTGATRGVFQQTFPAGTGPQGVSNFLSYAQSVAGSGGTFTALEQRIEGVSTFAGQTVTLSFYARNNASTALPQIICRQFFGTGGSAVVSTTVATSIATTSSFSLYKCSFTVPSIVGKTIAGGDDWLGMLILLPVNSVFTFDITAVQLEIGAVATPFEFRPIGMELALCQRYFFSNAVGAVMAWSAGGLAWFGQAQLFPVQMRTTPGIITQPSGFTIQGITASATGFAYTATAAYYQLQSAAANGQADGVCRRVDPNSNPSFSAEL